MVLSEDDLMYNERIKNSSYIKKSVIKEKEKEEKYSSL